MHKLLTSIILLGALSAITAFGADATAKAATVGLIPKLDTDPYFGVAKTGAEEAQKIPGVADVVVTAKPGDIIPPAGDKRPSAPGTLHHHAKATRTATRKPTGTVSATALCATYGLTGCYRGPAPLSAA